MPKLVTSKSQYMQEQVQQKVARSERHRELLTHMQKGVDPNNPNSYKMNPMFAYIAQLLEQAYIAGANRVRCIKPKPASELEDTGAVLVDAQNFVKDKGFRV